MSTSQQPDSDGDDLLPGELAAATDEQMMAVGLRIIRQSLPDTPEEMLTQTLALYHEEWQRRNPGERWVIEEED